jgi:hypothetical protein
MKPASGKCATMAPSRGSSRRSAMASMLEATNSPVTRIEAPVLGHDGEPIAGPPVRIVRIGLGRSRGHGVAGNAERGFGRELLRRTMAATGPDARRRCRERSTTGERMNDQGRPPRRRCEFLERESSAARN